MKTNTKTISSTFLRHMPCVLIATVLSFTAGSTAAKPISSTQALSNAVSFLQQRGINVSLNTVRRAPSLKKDSTESLYYVFTLGADKGFVIASGDDLAPAVLAYSDKGSFRTDSIPCNVQYWMKKYERQIQLLREKGTGAKKQKKIVRDHTGKINSLLTSKWGQEAPYNNTCPKYKGGMRCLTGCAATAMAQMMFYHSNYSTNKVMADIPGYSLHDGQTKVESVPKGSPIDWDNMLNEYDQIWSDEQGIVDNCSPEESMAVAELMRYAGTSIEMLYGFSESIVFSLYDIESALINYFDYDEGVRYENRSDFSDSEWESMIYEDLSHNRPIVYQGGNHAYVIDGWDPEGYVHINFGWRGIDDGFYLLGSYGERWSANRYVGEMPTDDEIYSDKVLGGYRGSEAAIFRAEPNGRWPRLTTLDIKLNSGNVFDLSKTNGSFSVNIGMTVSNKSDKSYNFHQAVGLYRNNRLWCLLTTLNDTGNLYVNGQKEISFNAFVPDTLSRGNYKIVPMSRAGTDNKWHPNANYDNVITLLVHNGQAKLVEGIPEVEGEIISFEDRHTKKLCVDNWDLNGDGELSREEAASVTSLDGVFREKHFRSFNELRYFSGLKSIDDEEFYECFGLSYITLPDGLVSIGARVFHYCLLEKLNIPKSVRFIDKDAFTEMIYDRLEEISVDEDNPYFDSRDNCQAIIETSTGTLIKGCDNSHVPEGVKAIGDHAFEYCWKLSEVQLPEGVVSIGDEAFRTCGLTDITLPNSLSRIGKSAFIYCRKLTSVNLSHVKEIGDSAFAATALEEIVIPASVTSIGKYVLNECENLSHIEVETGNPRYDSRQGCNAIMETDTHRLLVGCKTSVIPSTTIIIGEEAFCECKGITFITFPKGLVSIEDKAFYRSKLSKQIVLSEGVTSIGESAFEGCYYIETLYLPSSLTYIGESAFKNYSTAVHHVCVNAKKPLAIPDVFFGESEKDYLYVPKGSKAAYMAADYWNHFNIIEMTGIEGDLNFDGDVTVTDVTILANVVLGKESEFVPITLCDLDNDNEITVTDVIYLVKKVLRTSYCQFTP